MSIKFLSKPITIEPSTAANDVPQRIYPMVQPPLNLNPIVDDGGFTKQEKQALVMSWNILKSKARNIGQGVFYKFLVDNHTYMNLFRDRNDPKNRLKLKVLHRHASLAFEMFGFIIENCLNNNLLLTQNLHNIIRIHKANGVSFDKVQKLINEIEVKLCKELVNHYSETITRGLHKIRARISFVRVMINTRLMTNELYGIRGSFLGNKQKKYIWESKVSFD